MSHFLYNYLRVIYHSIREFIYRLLPPKYVANRFYKKRFGKSINWDNPKNINEKINWLKFYSDTTIWSTLADKYAVRRYVSSCGLSEILIPLIGKWDKIEDVEWDKLPNEFVLKLNNGSGDILLVTDKANLDIPQIQIKYNKLLKKPFGIYTGEPHYKRIQPCIIIEKLLTSDNDPRFHTLIDYKIWCFNGEPYFIWACYNRQNNKVYVETHDLNWNFCPEKSVFNDHYLDGKGIIPKPAKLDEMINIARILSQGFPQVRVDLYFVENKIYFGEMTFTSDGGYNDFYTESFLNELGDQVKIDLHSIYEK